MGKRLKEVTLADVHSELLAIKRLLAYDLVQRAGQIKAATALGVAQSSVSEMFKGSSGKGKKRKR